jgi:hypothetical protein
MDYESLTGLHELVDRLVSGHRAHLLHFVDATRASDELLVLVEDQEHAVVHVVADPARVAFAVVVGGAGADPEHGTQRFVAVIELFRLAAGCQFDVVLCATFGSRTKDDAVLEPVREVVFDHAALQHGSHCICESFSE